MPMTGIVVGAESNAPPGDLARAMCAKIIECGASTVGAVTEDECVVYFSQPCFNFGNVGADDGLAACLSSIRAIPCDNMDLELGIDCINALNRAQARATGLPLQTVAGGTCGDGVGCSDLRLCDGFGGECGVCTDIPDIGESCTDLGACWMGYCDRTTQICTAPKPDGEACITSNECESESCSIMGVCTPDSETVCEDDFDCASGRCDDSRCVEPAPPGGACANSEDCESSGFCDDGICKLVARCSLGQAGEPCGIPGCARDLQCTQGVCTEPATPGMPEGSSCSFDHECVTGYCGRDFFGDPPNLCAKKPTGRSCDADDQCSSNKCVNFRCAGSAMCFE